MQGIEMFFKFLFGSSVNGYVCLARLNKERKGFKEDFFEWPSQIDDMMSYVGKHLRTHNLYVCPQVLEGPKRTKESAKVCTNAWADLDECKPEEALVPPTITIQSSPGRYQAYWVFEDALEPAVAEHISKRIAYYHAFQGADKSGWDLTQLLRVPGTFNYNHGKADVVEILRTARSKYREEDFKVYPLVDKDANKHLQEVKPEEAVLKQTTGEDILDKYVGMLPPQVDFLFHNTPEGPSWNEALWRLQLTLFEAQLTKEEVYIVARDSACNKFRRDNSRERADELLWRDVCRSYVKHAEDTALEAPQDLIQSKLLSTSERKRIANRTTFVDEYITWAKSLGDAAAQYHQAGAFTILSALLGGSVRLPTSFGTMKPNLWFMILADTTLTRKSTAMDIAMDLIEEVDSGAILATDGSIEGLMGSLSTRPGQPSVFLRDEFSGLLEAITKKDYYAGMAETLTKLYDGKMQKRVLKKEVIEVKDPVLIVFAGGIRNKVCSLLTHEYVSSGFIPRFVFITAESDPGKVRPLGPPKAADTAGRTNMLTRMRVLHDHYRLDPKLVLQDGKMMYSAPQHWDAALTEEAWARYNQLELQMMQAGLDAEKSDIMTPTYDRLCKSILKAAVLLAASQARPEPGAIIQVTLDDLLQAIGMGEEWREHVNLIVRDIGITRDEREFQKIFNYITRKNGVTRSQLMQQYHLTARATDIVLNTLEQRGLIVRQKLARGERLFPAKLEKQDLKAST
jgi:hypothetical protein